MYYIEHFYNCVCFFMSWCLLHLAVICAKSFPEGIRSSYHFVCMDLSKIEKGVLVKSKKLLHVLAGKLHRFSNILLGYSQLTSLHTCVCMYLLQNTFTTAFAFLCPDAFYTWPWYAPKVFQKVYGQAIILYVWNFQKLREAIRHACKIEKIAMCPSRLEFKRFENWN